MNFRLEIRNGCGIGEKSGKFLCAGSLHWYVPWDGGGIAMVLRFFTFMRDERNVSVNRWLLACLRIDCSSFVIPVPCYCQLHKVYLEREDIQGAVDTT
jgi:hypothetical protein